jgi:hypothetical protein
VDAEMQDGQAIVWCLDIRWGESGWVIDYSVRITDSQGQYPFREFEVKTASNAEGFVAAVAAATEELVGTSVGSGVPGHRT